LLYEKVGELLSRNKALLFISASVQLLPQKTLSTESNHNNSEIWLSTFGMVLKLDTRMQSFSVLKAVEY
jgi:hypothetical protein